MKTLAGRGLRALGAVLLTTLTCASAAWAGGIAGTVTDSVTLAPLPSVFIDVYDSAGDYVAGASTNAAGTYTVTGLADGTYFARTYNDDGYINELYSNITCLSFCNVSSGAALVVAGGGTVSGVDFALARGGRVAGTIIDAVSLLPLAGVSVDILTLGGDSVSHGYTDSTGHYISSDGVPGGSYFVRTNNSDGYLDELYDNIACVGTCSVGLGTPVAVTAGATTTGINFGLTRGGRISGVVTDAATALPLANVSVALVNAGGQSVSWGYTDSAGAYTGDAGVPAGTYFARTFNNDGYVDELYDDVPCTTSSNNCIASGSGTPIVVAGSGTTTGIDFALGRGARIAGTVTAAGTGLPLGGVYISIADASGFEVSWSETDAAGAYVSHAGLLNGSYYVRALDADGYVNQLYPGIPCASSCPVSAGTAIAVSAPLTTSGINFSLTLGGRVSGIVRDGVTLAPLSNVTVDVVGATGTFLSSGFTDSSGVYTTTDGIPDGIYYVRTNNSQGYINELFGDVPCVGFCTPTAGATVAVTAGTTVTGVDFDLTRGARIAGQVTAAGTGTPIGSVTVTILSATGTNLTTATTDPTGNFLSRAGLPTGTYFLRTENSQGFLNQRYSGVACNGTQCPATGGTAVAASLGTTTSGINFSLSPGARISGHVTDAATALPLINAQVSVVDAAGLSLGSARTDALGNYRSGAGLTPGSYFVRTLNDLGYVDELYDNVSCPRGSCATTGGTAVLVSGSATTGGIDFGLALGGRISGTVRDAASLVPLANVSVSINDAGGNIFVGSASTSSLGQYTVVGLPAGSYRARTSNSLGYINELYNNIACFPSCQTAAGTPIAVAAGGTTSGVDFDLTAGGRISGTVTEEGTGLPLAGVTVSFLTPANSTVNSTTTDLAGHYVSSSGLVTGNYYVVTRNAQGYLNELYPGVQCVGGCTLATGTPVAVTSGSTVTGIDFALGAGGRVTGNVTNATAVPLASVTVNVYDASSRFVTSGSTDALGAYVLRDGLPSGSYFARTSNFAGYVDELFADIVCLGSCPVTQGTPFAVTVGTTTSGIDFALNLGGRIAGTVTATGTGLPIQSISIQLYDSSGRFVASGFTDVSGNYQTDAGVPAGTYFARTTNGSGFINELFGGAVCLGGCVVTTGTPISVPATGVLAGINFSLAPGGRIAGAITLAGTGDPLASVSVTVFDSSGNFATSATSDFFGNYVTRDGLTSGSYFARTNNGQGYVDQLHQTPANVDCLGCTVTSGAPIAVTVGATTSPIDFALNLGARLAGTVTRAADATPIPNARVSLLTAAGVTVAGATTDGLGNYATTTGVPTGTYFARTQNSQGFIDEFWNDHACVSSCVVADGDPIALTAGAVAGGFDFALVPDGDGDGDGIANTIDRIAATGADQSAVFSSEFSDIPLAGTTAGVITSRGGFGVTVGDVAGGVQAGVSGAGSEATLEVCATGGAEGVSLDAAGELVQIFCNPTTGSTNLRAIQATPVVELRDPPTGAGVVVRLTTGQAATAGSPVTADPSNTEPIRVEILDAGGVVIGSFDLDPGESVDTVVNANGSVNATSIAGTVTITVRGSSETLSPGESHTFPGTDPSAAIREAIRAIERKVDELRAAHQIRSQHAAREIKESLAHARQLVGHHNQLAKAHLRLAILKVLFYELLHQVTHPARHTLVTAIHAAIDMFP